MKILGIRISAFLPGEISGANRSIDMILRQLVRRGHASALLCCADATSASSTSWYTWSAPYAIFRLADPLAALPGMLATLQPDVVLVYGSRVTPAIAAKCSRAGIRCVHFASTASLERIEGVFTALPGLTHVAASRYTAQKFSCWYGLPVAIVPPMIEGPSPERLAVGGDHVVFVNPIPEKGIHLLFRVASMLPHRCFRVFESWTLDQAWSSHIRRLAPANIEWQAPVIDTSLLFRDARMVLMPSVWEESWGRTASEAQSAGVPVIASNLGGLPESVGQGGTTIGLSEPFGVWTHAIERLFDDTVHAAARRAALAHATRAGFDIETLTDKWQQLLSTSTPTPPGQ